MGFASFMNDPKSYLGHHRAEIRNAPPSALASQAGGAVALLNGKHSVLYTQAPAVFISMIHTVGSGQAIHSSNMVALGAKLGMGRIQRSFQPIPSGADIGLRYLPFQENHCTYMRLDGAATFFITGPLSGCTIAAARHAGAVTLFHSNDNVGTGVVARLTQRASIVEVCNTLAIPVGNLRYCEYQTAYDGLGFVFGRRRNAGVWKFYAHATNLTNQTNTRKWAEI